MKLGFIKSEYVNNLHAFGMKYLFMCQKNQVRLIGKQKYLKVLQNNRKICKTLSIMVEKGDDFGKSLQMDLNIQENIYCNFKKLQFAFKRKILMKQQYSTFFKKMCRRLEKNYKYMILIPVKIWNSLLYKDMQYYADYFQKSNWIMRPIHGVGSFQNVPIINKYLRDLWKSLKSLNKGFMMKNIILLMIPVKKKFKLDKKNKIVNQKQQESDIEKINQKIYSPQYMPIIKLGQKLLKIGDIVCKKQR